MFTPYQGVVAGARAVEACVVIGLGQGPLLGRVSCVICPWWQVHRVLCFLAGQIAFQPETMAVVGGGLPAEVPQVRSAHRAQAAVGQRVSADTCPTANLGGVATRCGAQLTRRGIDSEALLLQ